MANTILLFRLDAFEMCIVSQSIENILDGYDYQRGRIENDGNRQRNSVTIQDKKVTISSSRTSYKAFTHHNWGVVVA